MATPLFQLLRPKHFKPSLTSVSSHPPCQSNRKSLSSSCKIDLKVHDFSSPLLLSPHSEHRVFCNSFQPSSVFPAPSLLPMSDPVCMYSASRCTHTEADVFTMTPTALIDLPHRSPLPLTAPLPLTSGPFQLPLLQKSHGNPLPPLGLKCHLLLDPSLTTCLKLQPPLHTAILLPHFVTLNSTRHHVTYHMGTPLSLLIRAKSPRLSLSTSHH